MGTDFGQTAPPNEEEQTPNRRGHEVSRRTLGHKPYIFFVFLCVPSCPLWFHPAVFKCCWRRVTHESWRARCLATHQGDPVALTGARTAVASVHWNCPINL